MLWILITSPLLAGERCGPTQCKDGQICGNETCGICTEPIGGSVIDLDCGWTPTGIAGHTTLLPAGMRSPVLGDEVQMWVGMSESTPTATLAGRWWAGRSSLALRGAAQVQSGAIPDGDLGVTWSLPLGQPRTQLAVLVEGGLADGTTPRAEAGLALVQGVSSLDLIAHAVGTVAQGASAGIDAGAGLCYSGYGLPLGVSAAWRVQQSREDPSALHQLRTGIYYTSFSSVILGGEGSIGAQGAFDAGLKVRYIP